MRVNAKCAHHSSRFCGSDCARRLVNTSRLMVTYVVRLRHSVQLITGATRPGPPHPPAASSLALATHFSGRTYLSLIFFRYSG